MSTRGAVGFRKGNKDYLIYNHCDSYPSGLGYGMLRFIKESNIAQLNNVTDIIYDLSRDSSVFDDMTYVPDIFVQCVTDLEKDNANHFLHDSLFCEYGYLINLDTQQLEFYVGSNKLPLENKGRYAKIVSHAIYGGVVLAKTLSFDFIKESTLSDLVVMLEHRTQKMRVYQELAQKKNNKELVALIKDSIDSHIAKIMLSEATLLKLTNGLNLKSNVIYVKKLNDTFFRFMHNARKYEITFTASNDNSQQLNTVCIHIKKLGID